MLFFSMLLIDVSMMMRRNIESLTIVGEMTTAGNNCLYYHRRKAVMKKTGRLARTATRQRQ
jgi:hypothetical protein